jgi:hypothetical protein
VANVDFESPVEVDALLEQELQAAEARVHVAVKKLKAASAIDGRGNRKNKKLPPDMQPGSRCQLPG